MPVPKLGWKLRYTVLVGTPSVFSPGLSPLGPVCTDNHPDELWGHLAMYLPPRVVVFPDWIHDFPDCPLHELLHSGNPHLSLAAGLQPLTQEGSVSPCWCWHCALKEPA